MTIVAVVAVVHGWPLARMELAAIGRRWQQCRSVGGRVSGVSVMVTIVGV